MEDYCCFNGENGVSALTLQFIMWWLVLPGVVTFSSESFPDFKQEAH